jgi:membrane-associated protein
VIGEFVEYVVHLDQHLAVLVTTYGTWTYAILCAILFAETGLVVTPFLPGDSLLFAVGAVASTGSLQIEQAFLLLAGAVILGDSTNYWIGRVVGPRIFRAETSRFFNRRHLLRTHQFYEKHGGKTVIIARFMPILRTFAPFVAGVGSMRYPRFLAFSVGGTLLWVGLFVHAGYYFGNIPWVKKNFSIVILAIILISLIPAVVEFLRHRGTKRSGPGAGS